MNNDIVIIGSGGHAKVIIDIVEKQGLFNIVGLIDAFKAIGTEVFGYKVIGNESVLLTSNFQNVRHGIVAIGDNWVRHQVVKKIIALCSNFQFVTAIHPSANIAKGVTIGNGTVLMAGSILNSDTIVGDHCIINTNSSLDHDNIIGDFVTIAPGAVTGGNVAVGDFSSVSLGAKVIHKIVIGKHSLVGAGSVVVNNVESQSVCYGVPAKMIRERSIGEKYL